MEYRAVGSRCAVNFDSLKLPIANNDALKILASNGFSVVEVDIIALARKFVGVSQYRRAARFSEAPEVVDCSSLIKYLYGQLGIWLPRRSIQQSECGDPVGLNNIAAGDVLFISGRINYYHDNLADGIGHVGIVTEKGTVIHAANSRVGVVERPLEDFMNNNDFRKARRYVPKNAKIFTLETPADREVEIADDLKWIILQSLSD